MKKYCRWDKRHTLHKETPLARDPPEPGAWPRNLSDMRVVERLTP